VLRVTCLAAVALVISACGSSDAVTSVNGPPLNDAGTGSATIHFTRVDLGTLGGRSSYATAINSSGVVVGWSETGPGETHAFRWTPSSGMVDLGTLAGHQSSLAVAILDGAGSGVQILGMSSQEAVIWSGSAITPLQIPLITTASYLHPQAFNERGEVVGFDAGGGVIQHGWVWSGGDVKADLSAAIQGGSNEGSANAITSDGVTLLTTRAQSCTSNPECWRAYLWHASSGFQSLGVPDNDLEASVTGLGMNEARTVVGWTDATTRGAAPYRWTAVTGFSHLPTYSPGGYGYATAVNSGGNAVGAAQEPVSGSIVATLWPTSGGMQRLSPDDDNSSVAVAINSNGTIAGWASLASGVNHAVIWVPSTQLGKMQAAGLTQSSTVASLPSRASASAVSTGNGCLKEMRAIRSRQALFACVIDADIAQRSHSR